MDEQIREQIAFGIAAVIVGASGWLLPFRWNVLRLRRLFASLLSEDRQKLVPKIVGSLCILVGVVVLAATAIVGKF
jgi:hypothetical protein